MSFEAGTGEAEQEMGAVLLQVNELVALMGGAFAVKIAEPDTTAYMQVPSSMQQHCVRWVSGARGGPPVPPAVGHSQQQLPDLRS